MVIVHEHGENYKWNLGAYPHIWDLPSLGYGAWFILLTF